MFLVANDEGVGVILSYLRGILRGQQMHQRGVFDKNLPHTYTRQILTYTHEPIIGHILKQVLFFTSCCLLPWILALPTRNLRVENLSMSYESLLVLHKTIRYLLDLHHTMASAKRTAI